MELNNSRILALVRDLDRSALMGQLSGGVIHALNNILAAAVGNLDLLMIRDLDGEVRSGLTAVMDSFDEGTDFLKALTEVTTALNTEQPGQPDIALAAIVHILSRIHRRSAIEVEHSFQNNLIRVPNLARFSQAGFHLLNWAFRLASGLSPGSRRLDAELIREKDMAVLRVTVPGGRFISHPDAEPAPPSPGDRDEFDFWMLSGLTDGCGTVKFLDAESLELHWELQ